MDKRTSKQAITIQRSRFEGNGYSPRCTTILDIGYFRCFFNQPEIRENWD